MFVDGRPLPTSFQRSASYCEQVDVHEGTATVQEASIFSARFRQPRIVPDGGKISYVEKVIELLELEKIQDAIISVPGSGLTMEQRKRVTIGGELVAKPTTLPFLMNQLLVSTDSLLSMLCDSFSNLPLPNKLFSSIHQPSASLFESFDMLLFLAKGGKAVYFGEMGRNYSILLNYLAHNSAPSDPDANSAEHIIDAVSGTSSGGRD